VVIGLFALSDGLRTDLTAHGEDDGECEDSGTRQTSLRRLPDAG